MNPAAVTQEDAARLLRRATLAATLVAVTLILGKAVVWWLSGSVALLASLVDSLMDGGASLVTLLAVRYSLQPADAEHRFGHGKAEALAGLGQSAFISVSATLLMIEGARKALNPEPVTATTLAVGMMLVSIVLTLALVSYQRHVVRMTRSTAVAGDALHYASDLVMNVAIIGAIIAAGYGYARVDALVALVIGAFMLVAALRIGYMAVQLLLDHELEDDERTRIAAAITAHPGVQGFHDLRTRRSGRTTFIQVHVELDKDLSLEAAHAIIAGAGRRVRELMPGAEVIIHADPVPVGEVSEVGVS